MNSLMFSFSHSSMNTTENESIYQNDDLMYQNYDVDYNNSCDQDSSPEFVCVLKVFLYCVPFCLGLLGMFKKS